MYDSKGLMAAARNQNQLCTPEMPRQMTIRENLEVQKKALEERLASITEALALMDKHPEFEAVHDAVTKAGY